MKKMIFFLIRVILCLNVNSIYAKKWRVNNTGIPSDFTTANAAVNSPLVSNGDTVYFESSMLSYGGLYLVKRLVIIGPGYFLGENDSTQADLKPASFDQATFSTGSNGTIVRGMTFTHTYNDLGASGITLENNRIEGMSVNSGGSGNVIIRNYITTLSLTNTQNALVANNVIIKSAWNEVCFFIQTDASATVLNNIFLGKVSIRNSVFRNNICTLTAGQSPLFFSENSTVENNIGASTQFGTTNGNQENVDMTTVFEFTGSSDGQYKLKAGSPAIGAGVGGTDCGMFGGNYPYILSGMVSGPSVWYLNMNGIEVTVKAKSH